jgi:hypothetical protein
MCDAVEGVVCGQRQPDLVTTHRVPPVPTHG